MTTVASPLAGLRAFALCCLTLLLLAMPMTAGIAAEPPPSAAQLAELLENEDTRRALIEQLRQSATTAEPAVAVAIEAPEGPSGLPQRLAAATQSIATRTVEEASASVEALSAAWTQLSTIGFGELWGELIGFVAFAATVLIVFWLCSRSVNAALARRENSFNPASDKVLRGFVTIGLTAALKLFAVLIAWLAGYGLALLLPGVGESGQLRVEESLFLNAFLVVEGLRAILAAALANRLNRSHTERDGEEAAYWNAWASRMIYFLGYGLMLIAPAAHHLLAPEIGRALTLLILLVAFLKATVLIMQNRLRVRHALESLSARMQTAFARVALVMIARVWHIAAVIYSAALLVTAVFYPEQALGFMVGATLQTLIAALAGVALSMALSSVIMRRIRLPEDTRLRFPLLEARLNAYIPTVLKVARFMILLVVLAFMLDAWTYFDLGAWARSDAGLATLGKIVTIALIVSLALVVWLLSASWIEYRLNPNAGHGDPTARVKTLLTLFRNAIAITLVVLTTMVLLAELGINIGPLIAGAGVLGLAIGFGSQRLVQDVITGLFIQLESAINVGDVVTAGGVTGGVEKLTIRSLGIRDLSGVYHLIPFSSVNMVANFNRDFGFHVGEYGVAYREDTDEVIEHLQAAFEELRNDPEHKSNIISDLEVHGITSLADSSVNIRVRIKTLAGKQAGTGRAYNRLVKRHFDAAGIEIPFPHMTVYFGEDKQGNAPPANLRLLDVSGQRKPDPT